MWCRMEKEKPEPIFNFRPFAKPAPSLPEPSKVTPPPEPSPPLLPTFENMKAFAIDSPQAKTLGGAVFLRNG